jgi:hypothetical protein
MTKLVAIIADNGANDQDKELVKKAQAVIIPLAYLIELPVDTFSVNRCWIKNDQHREYAGCTPLGVQ